VSKDEPSKDEERKLVRKRQEVIGHALQKLYDSVLDEPIPSDLLDLMSKIDEKAKDSEQGQPGGDLTKQDPSDSA